jgi:hypothetical protein
VLAETDPGQPPVRLRETRYGLRGATDVYRDMSEYEAEEAARKASLEARAMVKEIVASYSFDKSLVELQEA